MPEASDGTLIVIVQVLSPVVGTGVWVGTGVTPAGYGLKSAVQTCPRPARAPAKRSSVAMSVPVAASTVMPCTKLIGAREPGGSAGSIGRVQVSEQYTVASAEPAGGIWPCVR